MFQWQESEGIDGGCHKINSRASNRKTDITSFPSDIWQSVHYSIDTD